LYKAVEFVSVMQNITEKINEFSKNVHLYFTCIFDVPCTSLPVKRPSLIWLYLFMTVTFLLM